MVKGNVLIFVQEKSEKVVSLQIHLNYNVNKKCVLKIEN